MTLIGQVLSSVSQRRKKPSARRNGGKTGNSIVTKKTKKTKEKVVNVHFAHIANVCSIAIKLFKKKKLLSVCFQSTGLRNIQTICCKSVILFCSV